METNSKRRAGYEGPGEGVGNIIVPASFYGPGPGYDKKESAWKQSDAWMAFLNETLPESITFLYMPDEPRRAQFPKIRELADNIHSNPGPGRKLPIFVTHRYNESLAGAIDIGVPAPEVTTSKKLRKKGPPGGITGSITVADLQVAPW